MAAKRKRMIDRTPEEAARILIERHGRGRAEQVAHYRYDMAETEMTAEFYQCVEGIISRSENRKKNRPLTCEEARAMFQAIDNARD